MAGPADLSSGVPFFMPEVKLAAEAEAHTAEPHMRWPGTYDGEREIAFAMIRLLMVASVPEPARSRESAFVSRELPDKICSKHQMQIL